MILSLSLLLFAAGQERASEVLLKQLKDSDAAVRLAAVRKVGGGGNKDHAPLLLPLLEDEDGRVRWAVAEALRDLNARYLERSEEHTSELQSRGLISYAV